MLRWGDWNFKKLSSKDLHKIRIDFKRARYLEEFLLTCGMRRKDFKNDIGIFTFFQDILGKHHDALTVIKNVKEASEDIGLNKADIRKVIKSEKMRAKNTKIEFANKLRLLTANGTYKIRINNK